MKIKKQWYKNLSVYSSFGLIIAFLYLGGYIQIGIISKLILLGSAGTTLMFIVTRIIHFDNWEKN